MNRKYLFITLLFLLLTSCSFSIPSAEQRTGKITGKAVDSSDGSSVPFANVVTEPPTGSVTTDADGNYTMHSVPPGNYTIIAIKLDATSREVRVAVTASETTTADLHFVFVQTHLPTTMPTSVPSKTPTDVYLPPPIGSNLLANGNLDEDDFGSIANWAHTDIKLLRWYLVQDVAPDIGTENARWVEQVKLVESERDCGLKSTDYQSCSSFCSTSAVQIVPAQENRVYTLSVEARKEEGGGTLYLDFLNANKRRIKAHTKGGFSDEWSQQEITAVAPEGTRYIRVALYTNNNNQGIIYWDNVELRENE
jgi:hypothetical protein